MVRIKRDIYADCLDVVFCHSAGTFLGNSILVPT
jgi:hypothetical protein